MKKTLLAVFLIASVASSAQVILNIMHPLSMAGPIAHTNQGNTTGWGLADLMDPADAVMDTVVAMDDGTPGVNTLTGAGYPGIEKKREGCNTDTLASTPACNFLRGKIVLIARGTCEFGLKCFLAQQAGAVGIIVYNRENAQLIMGPGVYGAQVFIPVSAIARPDGDALLSAITGGQTIVAFLGNKTGAFVNDVSINKAEIMFPRAAAEPKEMVLDSSMYEVPLGFWARNDGSANQTSVTAKAEVKLGGTVLHAPTSPSFAMNSADSIYVSFPPFKQPTYAPGRYSFTYSLQLTGENFPADNEFASNVDVNDSIFSYVRVADSTLTPIDNNSYRFATAPNTLASSCIAFQHPEVEDLELIGIRFSNYIALPDSIAGRYVDITVDEWNDAFVDVLDTNLAVSSTVNLISETYTYTSQAENDAVVTHMFTNPVMLDDDQRYLMCINTSDALMYFNHSTVYGYEQNNRTAGTQPKSIHIRDGALGDWGNAIPTITLITKSYIGVREFTLDKSMAFPNPATHTVNIPMTVEGKADVRVYDMTGKVVIDRSAAITYGRLTVDVSALPAGSYVFHVNAANGHTSRFNVIVSR